MRILVTGGSGFIGTTLVQCLLDDGHAVKNIDIHSPRNLKHQDLWFKCSLLQYQELRDAIQDFEPEVVYHLAARTDLLGSSESDYLANTTGTENVIRVLENCISVRRVFFASSRLVCKIGYCPKSETDYFPTTPYGESKVAFEKIVRTSCSKAHYDWLIFRPTSIWGPFFGVPYRDFFDAVMKGRYIHPKGKRIYKSFGYIGNVVDVLKELATCEPSKLDCGTYYLTDQNEIEVLEWANTIRKASGQPPVIEVPAFVLKAVAIVGDIMKFLGVKNPPLTSFRLDNLLTEMKHDTDFVKSICPVPRYSSQQGVQATLDWLKAN